MLDNLERYLCQYLINGFLLGLSLPHNVPDWTVYAQKLVAILGEPIEARKQFISWFGKAEKVAEQMCPFLIYLLIDGSFNQELAAELNQLLQK